MKKLFLFLLILILPGSAWSGPPITQGINTGAMGAISASSITDTGLTASKPVFTDASKVLVSTGTLAVDQGGTNCSSASVTCFNNITGYTAGGATGTTSTNLVFSTSPALTTPTLGAATATTIAINGLLYWGSATDNADEDEITLPTITANYSGHGFVRVSAAGVIADSCEFESGSDGNVSLIRATANVVVGAACADTKICISSAAGQNPIIVKPRNGAGKVEIEFWYK